MAAWTLTHRHRRYQTGGIMSYFANRVWYHPHQFNCVTCRNRAYTVKWARPSLPMSPDVFRQVMQWREDTAAKFYAEAVEDDR